MKILANESMMEQIRRLNAEEAQKHKIKRIAALNKIHKMREQQRNEIRSKTTVK